MIVDGITCETCLACFFFQHQFLPLQQISIQFHKSCDFNNATHGHKNSVVNSYTFEFEFYLIFLRTLPSDSLVASISTISTISIYLHLFAKNAFDIILFYARNKATTKTHQRKQNLAGIIILAWLSQDRTDAPKMLLSKN